MGSPFKRKPPKSQKVDVEGLKEFRYQSQREIQNTIDYLIHKKVSQRRLCEKGFGKPVEKSYNQIALKTKELLRERTKERARERAARHEGAFPNAIYEHHANRTLKSTDDGTVTKTQGTPVPVNQTHQEQMSTVKLFKELQLKNQDTIELPSYEQVYDEQLTHSGPRNRSSTRKHEEHKKLIGLQEAR